MAGEVKLYSSVLPTVEALVVRCAVRHCRGELGPFCPLLAAGIAISVHLINLLGIFLRCNVSQGFRKL